MKKYCLSYNSSLTEVFDQPEEQLPVPEFANAVKLTVAELFGWLVEQKISTTQFSIIKNY